MLKKIIKLSIVASFTINMSFASGIPVVDAAANAQMMQQNIKQVLEWAKEAKRWIDTANHYQAQLSAYSNELATKSGVRDSVQFIKEAKSIYDEAKDFGKTIGQIDLVKDSSSISSKLKKLMDKYYDYDCEKLGGTVNSVNTCYQNRKDTIEDIVFYDERSKVINNYSNNINRLVGSLRNSKDIKESSDINNAIQAQVALMQSEKMQIDLYNEKKKKNKEILKQREAERIKKKFYTPLPKDFFEDK